ncbi:MAG: hypothetical protein AAF727_11415 [Pseudomonadota bacterium]
MGDVNPLKMPSLRHLIDTEWPEWTWLPPLDKAMPCSANAQSLPERKAAMFSLIRTPVLLLVAFLAGLLFERSQAADACVAAGGMMRDGVCRDV